MTPAQKKGKKERKGKERKQKGKTAKKKRKKMEQEKRWHLSALARPGKVWKIVSAGAQDAGTQRWHLLEKKKKGEKDGICQL